MEAKSIEIMINSLINTKQSRLEKKLRFAKPPVGSEGQWVERSKDTMKQIRRDLARLDGRGRKKYIAALKEFDTKALVEVLGGEQSVRAMNRHWITDIPGLFKESGIDKVQLYFLLLGTAQMKVPRYPKSFYGHNA